MIRAFYSGWLGVKGQQTAMDSTANNIANVNTVGYKPKRVDFADTLYSNIIRNRTQADQRLLAGSGVRPVQTPTTFRDGALMPTDRPLDLAIEGSGFFAVADGQGNVSYTRAGGMYIGYTDDVPYLMSSGGRYVLGQDGNPIVIDAENDTQLAEQIGNGTINVGVFEFQNRDGLFPFAGTGFLETPLSGPATLVAEPVIHQGVLEGSGVDITGEFSNMMQIQRAFQLSARVITTADELEQTVNGLRP